MKKAIYIFLLVVISLFTLFVGNRVKPADAMESRNLAIASEMAESGNYLNPTLNGEQISGQPPLPTWGAAVVEKLFPGSISWQRNLAGVMGTLWVVFTFLVAIELGSKQRQSFWIGLIMATCYSLMLMSRSATPDIWCHAMMSIAIFLYVKGIKSNTSGIMLFVTAGCFMGLSFLSNGPVSFYTLLIPFLAAYHIVFMPSLSGKWLSAGVMVIMALIVGGWWCLYLNLSAGDTISSILPKATATWADNNSGPWYYYYLFFMESGVWCLYWVASLTYTFIYGWYKKEKLLVMSALWTVISLVLLSIPKEKDTRYLLPMMMPCAVSVGSWLYVLYLQLKSNFTRIEGITVFKIISALISVIMVGTGIALFFKPMGISISFGTVMLSLVSIITGGLGIYLIFLKPNGRSLKFSCIKIRMLLFVFTVELCCIPLFGMRAIGQLMNNPEAGSIREFREINELNGHNIYYPVTEELSPQILYAAGKRILPIDFDREDAGKIGRPFVLILSKPVEEYHQLDGFKITILKRYDANLKRPDSHLYDYNLVKDIYFIE